jgi:X-Pro dipeptidyl-peptidase
MPAASRPQWTVALLAGLVAVATTMQPAPASAAPKQVSHVRGDSTIPRYSYANAIRESVWVDTPLDNDIDGKPDRVAVDLVRPREAARSGVKVPVIMEASPYYQCCGRGNESEVKEYGPDGGVTKTPLFYDNYFVPRGYAFAAVDLAGTSRSTGCEDVGGREEVLAAKAVIDWLNGRASGFYADGRRATASWTTGKVGMIGKSWDGSIANGVAATGVAGLTTIVPISAISSWYDYQRFNGVLRTFDYPYFLHRVVNGRPAGACDAVIARLRSGGDDATGNYNTYWRERDYRPAVGNVRASVFVVHGINDTNVMTSQFALWWQALASRGVSRKIWISQPGHEDPFDVRRAQWVQTLHRWFDFWLQGLHNGINREPKASVETSPGRWADAPDWPAATARPVTVSLGGGNGITGTLGGAPAPAGAVRTFRDNLDLSEADSVADPNTAKDGRLTFLSAPLTRDLQISGIPSVSLRVRVNKPTTQFTARLVDYGIADRIDYQSSEGVHSLATESCWGQSTTSDDACYRDTAETIVHSDHAVLTRGWLDAAHRASLSNPTPLRPHRWYTVRVPLQANEAVLPAGHVLGLVLMQSDVDYASGDDPVTDPLPSYTDATVELNLAETSLTIPVATGRLPNPGSAAPTVTTTRLPAFTATNTNTNRMSQFR